MGEWLFSTHSYTAHNERHGDTLLLRFIELRRSIKEFRWLINKSNVHIFSLIASLYTHDLGMLMNISNSSHFKGTLKEIHKSHSDYIRSFHGRNSSSIIIEWLGNYLNIKNEDITVMSLAAIAHEKGVSSLPPSSKKTIFTSLLLCILDLLDITSERSQLISRKIAGTIASEESKAHWIKHYFTHRITNYKLDNKENKLKIKIEMIDIEKRKKPNQCKKTCAILDSMNIKMLI